jgi:hypothetical protein
MSAITSPKPSVAPPSEPLAQTGKFDPTKPMPRLKAFMIIGNIKPGQAAQIRKMASERAAAASWQEMDQLLKPLTIHYARWALINNDSQLLYAAVFDTDFDAYVEDARHLFLVSGFPNFFEVMEGFPEDWRTNQAAFLKFFKEKHTESLYEFSSYPGVTVAEIEKALKLRRAFSEMLDQMQ